MKSFVRKPLILLIRFVNGHMLLRMGAAQIATGRVLHKLSARLIAYSVKPEGPVTLTNALCSLGLCVALVYLVVHLVMHREISRRDWFIYLTGGILGALITALIQKVKLRNKDKDGAA